MQPFSLLTSSPLERVHFIVSDGNVIGQFLIKVYERNRKKVMTEHHPNLFLVNDQDFETCVLHSTLPVIVEFTAEWCPPCRVLAPLYAQLSSSYEGRLRFAKMDIDENVLVPARFGSQGVPTLVLFAGGRPVGRLVGPHPGRLQQSIERLLAEVGAAVPGE
jgi:thioredoxin 1